MFLILCCVGDAVATGADASVAGKYSGARRRRNVAGDAADAATGVGE
jgi:hypothetical protein